MEVSVTNEDLNIIFAKDYSDVIEYLGAKKGLMKSTVPYLYNGVWTHLLYEIAYYELDLEGTYSIHEIESFVKTGKVILLSSKPYICVKDNDNYYQESKYLEDKLQTLSDYNLNNLNKNSNENNKLVLGMLKKVSEELYEKFRNKQKVKF